MAKKKTTETSTGAPTPTRRRSSTTRKAAAQDTPAVQADVTPAVHADDNGREPTQAEIAEAAYFRHLNRTGSQSDEFNDWVEAERELKQRYSR